MAARRQDKQKRSIFGLHRSKTDKQQSAGRGTLAGILKVLAVLSAVVAVAAALYFAEGYVRSLKSPETGRLELVDVPGWVNEQVRAKVVAEAGGETLALNDDTAHQVAENLAAVGYLDEVNVRITHEDIRVRGRWRKPLALVKTGLTKFYVDADLVVLEFVSMPNLPIITVKGVPVTRMPPTGQAIDRDDLAAAVAILALLGRLDGEVVPDKPLLDEIDRIDVSNFRGIEDHRLPHIVLYAKDNTQIIWGAEIGAWAQYLEAEDEVKLAKLYSYYKQRGSIMGGVKYINLHYPQDKVPQPIDKYR